MFFQPSVVSHRTHPISRQPIEGDCYSLNELHAIDVLDKTTVDE